MINAGFNPLQQISEKTGKSISELKEEMSKGAISAEMVQQAFIDATSAGGKFYQMSENASKTINGQLSMMQDAIDSAFNEMGQKSEGVIIKGIQMTTSLIENYETVGKVLAGLIATYGVYRAAVITNIVLTQSWATAARTDAAAKGIQTIATKAQTVAQHALNAAMKANPYVLLATAVFGLATAMWAMYDSTTELEKAQQKLNESVNESEKAALKEHRELARLKGELSTLKVGTDEYRAVKDKIVSQFGKYHDGLDAEITKIGLTEAAYNKLTEAINKSFNARQYEKFAKEQSESLESTMADNLVKIQERLYDKLGDETGARIYSKIRRGILDGSIKRNDKKSIHGNHIFAGIDDEVQKALDKAAGRDGGAFDISNSTIESSIYKILNAKKITDEVDKKARVRFGIDEVESKSKTDKDEDEKTTYEQDYEKAKKYWEDAKKKLSEIEKYKSKFDSKEYEEAKNKVEETEKAYKKLGGITGSSSTEQENQAEKLRKQTDKYNILLDKQASEQQRSAKDLQIKVDEARIKAMDEGSAKTIAEIGLNFRKEMQAINRQKEDALRKKVDDARAAWEANPQNKGKSFDSSGIKLSDDEIKAFDDMRTYVIEANRKAYDELTDKYKSYTDRRLEIEKKFNDDIAVLQEARKHAKSVGDIDQVEKIDRSIAHATKNKGVELMSLDYEEMKKSPEYVRAFENLEQTSTETLNSLLTQLENAKHTAAQVLSPDQLREYTTTIQDIMDELDSRNPFQALSNKKQELAEAEQELANAQDALERAKEQAETVRSGGKVEIAPSTKYNAKTGKIDSSKAYLSEAQALSTVKAKTDEYNAAKDKVVKKNAQVRKAEKDVKSQIDELAKTISSIGDSIGGSAGEIISLIGDIGSFTMTAMQGVETASKVSSNAIKTVEKASVILAIIGAALQIATKIFNLFSGSDTEKYEKAKEAYESYIGILDKMIDKHLELAETLSGENANVAYEKAIALLHEQSNNARVLGKLYLKSGGGLFKDTKGTNEVDEMSREGWEQAAGVLGMGWKDVYRMMRNSKMKSLFDLSAEQLAKLKEEAGIFWSQLDSETQKYANQIVDNVERILDVTEQKIKDTTLLDVDTLRSDFHNLLSDMDTDQAKLANNFEDYMRNAIINSMIKSEYWEKLKVWRKKFFEAMNSGNNVTESEYRELKEEGKRLAEEMKKRRDQYAEMYEWTSESKEQSSTKRGFGTEMTHEDAGELSGRFTALQIAGEEIKAQNIVQSQSLTLLTVQIGYILAVNSETRSIADEIRTELVNCFLELQSIRENTGAIIDPIMKMQKDMAEVKRNTSKL